MNRPERIGRAIRTQWEPEWDEADEARVLRKVLRPVRSRPRIQWLPMVGVPVGIAVLLVLVWRGSVFVGREDRDPGQPAAPMTASPPGPSGATTPRVPKATRYRTQAVSDEAVVPVTPQPASTSAATAAVTLDGSDRGAQAKVAQAPSNAATLLERADAARGRGKLVAATKLLKELIRLHPGHREIPAAKMSLARVLEQRARFSQAAAAYEALLHDDLAGTIGEDARAGAARTRARIGEQQHAVGHADAYLRDHPGGPHAAAMRDIVGR